jgi:hypothetical protein
MVAPVLIVSSRPMNRFLALTLTLALAAPRKRP